MTEARPPEVPVSSNRERVASVWVISDLQTSDPEEATRCLRTAIDDISATSRGFDQIWYLGDAIAGTDLEGNREVTGTQVRLLDEVRAPLKYVMGNHDLDYARETGETDSPFYDEVRTRSDWRTTDGCDDFYFLDELAGWTVLFLSDHVAPSGDWCVTHGKIRGEADRYPYTDGDYRGVCESLSEIDGPVITVGHNAFPGGNRPAAIQERFFPLPENVRLHLYGHAHIGDEPHMGENAYRTISHVDHHRIPQIDVASLEDRRSDTIRSAILHLYADSECGVFLRDHRRETWLESYHTHTKPLGVTR